MYIELIFCSADETYFFAKVINVISSGVTTQQYIPVERWVKVTAYSLFEKSSQ